MKDLIKKILKEEGVLETSMMNESSLTRINEYVRSYNCAVITAFRKQLINCHGTDVSMTHDPKVKINIRDNKGRNISLKSTLLYLGYGVTNVKGTYIENYMKENAVEVKEDSFFVVNSKYDPDFIKNIIKLGEIYCQDSVLILSNGGTENYLYGTNDSDYPGYGIKFNKDKYKPGFEGEFMTRVKGRPFVVESFGDLQINSKMIVSTYAKPILKLLS